MGHLKTEETLNAQWIGALSLEQTVALVIWLGGPTQCPPRSYHRVGSTLLHLLGRSAGSELSRSPISLTLFFSPFYFCFLGTSGISLSHNFYCGSIFKSNSLWTSLSPQRLPPQWLEFARFYNCGCRVSITTFLSSLPSPLTIHQHVPPFPSVICISFYLVIVAMDTRQDERIH